MDWPHEHTVLVEAIRVAGGQALKFHAEGFEVHTKADCSPVTSADLAVNALLHDRLLAAFPHDGWLSEESPDSDARLSKSRVWLVDPIDGTNAYTRKDVGLLRRRGVGGGGPTRRRGNLPSSERRVVFGGTRPRSPRERSANRRARRPRVSGSTGDRAELLGTTAGPVSSLDRTHHQPAHAFHRLGDGPRRGGTNTGRRDLRTGARMGRRRRGPARRGSRRHGP